MASPREADLRRLFDRSPVGMYRSTADGRFVYVNPALVAMLGYQRAEDVLALDLSRDLYVDPSERAPLVEHYLSRGVVDGVEVGWRRRDGAILRVRIYGYGVRDEHGDGFEATAVDVTELRTTATELRAERAESQRHAEANRMLLEQMPGLVWTTDRALRLTSAEGTGLRNLIPMTPSTPSPRTLYEFFGTADDAFPPIAHHHQALAGVVVHFEAEADDHTYATTVSPRYDADGCVIGTIGTAIDVTTVRRLERRLVDAQRAEALGVMAGGLAHDFNNLLAAMLGNADLALREVRGPGRQAVENIRTTALRAADLTSQLLASAGGGPRAVVDVALPRVVDELLGVLGPQLAGRAALSVELPHGLPPVRADNAQLLQVVLNLVTNARDAMPAGGGRIAVRARVVEHDGMAGADDVITPPRAGRYVQLEIEDDGCGIDATTRRRMFEPFYTTKPSGHGLGLAAVHGIVRSHGGGLRLHSRLGAGTRFQVLLPAAVVIAAPISASSIAGHVRIAHGTTPPIPGRGPGIGAGIGPGMGVRSVLSNLPAFPPVSEVADGSSPGLARVDTAAPGAIAPEGSARMHHLGGMHRLGSVLPPRGTVLVVDDEAGVRDVTCRMLEDIGYRTLDVPDGAAALAAARDPSLEIDAVILDLTMPGMGGRSVLAALRDSRPDTPVILCSGYDRDSATAEGAAAFLRKPFRFESLEEILLRVVGED